MLLQELIPSGAVLQVWKTITFRGYDSCMFEKNIQALNPSVFTEHPEIPAPWLSTGELEKKSRKQVMSSVVSC